MNNPVVKLTFSDGRFMYVKGPDGEDFGVYMVQTDSIYPPFKNRFGKFTNTYKVQEYNSDAVYLRDNIVNVSEDALVSYKW